MDIIVCASLFFGYEKIFLKSKKGDVVQILSGQYLKDEINILISQIDDNNAYFSFTNFKGFAFNGIAKINNNKIEGKIIEKQFTIELLNNNDLKVETSFEKINNGVYKKVKTIDFEEYFTLVYNKDNLFDSDYNGIYKNNDVTMYLYQKKKNTLAIYISKDNQFLLCTLAIIAKEDIEYAIFDDMYKLELLNGYSDVLFTVKNDVDKIYEGEYTKISSLKKEDILNSKLVEI